MGDRKARLAALAAKAGRKKPIRSEEDDNDIDASNKRAISFRNYAPNDASMEEQESKKARVEEEEQQEQSEPKSALQAALNQAQSEITTKEKSVESMAPKKINWDLKRDVEKKIAKLEKRTQKAIVELLKERLEREATEQAASGDDSDDLD